MNTSMSILSQHHKDLKRQRTELLVEDTYIMDYLVEWESSGQPHAVPLCRHRIWVFGNSGEREGGP